MMYCKVIIWVALETGMSDTSELVLDIHFLFSSLIFRFVSPLNDCQVLLSSERVLLGLPSLILA